MGRLRTAGLVLLLAACGSDNDRGPPMRSSAGALCDVGGAADTSVGGAIVLQPEIAFPNLAFSNPLLITHAGDGSNRLFVVEQAGRICVFANDASVASATSFLDIRSRVLSGGEMGMLGLAFDPNFASNGFFYVNYMRDNPRRTLISRFQVSATDSNRANELSEEILLEFNQPFTNHNGGMLAFGPEDGMLYIATGDGGSANDPDDNAQSLDTVLGKILRIGPNGSIPPDNPFVNGPVGARGEIWALGLRNPWRMSFDRATGRLWAGDVGQGAREEIDIIVEGGNYGWPVYEGTLSNANPENLPLDDFIAPIFEYEHIDGGRSITGGFVYRGLGLPDFTGAYIYADFLTGQVWALVFDINDTVLDNIEIANIPFPSSFGEDEAGELYVTSFDGRIYRFRQI